VIDEGTSALDRKTQSDVINQLNMLKNRPAIIMVAHRVEILENYDAIYEVKDGYLTRLPG
jgi:ABC-type bacteriocin/lantibiotic exporter with double-glycine peptidase domain